MNRGLVISVLAGLACAAAVLCVVPGCSPKLSAPAVEVPGRFAQGLPGDTLAVAELDRWWEMLGDTTLNRLIDSALKNNKDVLAASSNIRSAQLNRKVQRAAYLPSVGVGAGWEKELQFAKGAFYVEPSASWELSLFGALRNTTRMADAQVSLSKNDYQGLMLSLSAEVASTYYTLLGDRESYRLTQKSYDDRKRSTDLIDSMHTHGMRSGVDLAQSQELTAQAGALLPRLRQAQVQDGINLALLLGISPHRLGSVEADFPVQGPPRVPAGLPSDVLLRRWDVAAAQDAMDAAAAQVGIARAQRFPSIPLSASGGVASQTLKGLVSGDPLAWSAAVGIIQPIFAFGANKSREGMAKEHYVQAVLAYEKCVITALGEVEAALAAVGNGRERIVSLVELVRASGEASRLANALYMNGMGDYLSVLQAEQTWQTAQIDLVTAQSNLYASFAALCKALGGEL